MEYDIYLYLKLLDIKTNQAPVDYFDENEIDESAVGTTDVLAAYLAMVNEMMKDQLIMKNLVSHLRRLKTVLLYKNFGKSFLLLLFTLHSSYLTSHTLCLKGIILKGTDLFYKDFEETKNW
ncbi:hypothetical protein Avbf_07606 [Armadillidium vulgare]|nr:hypothetical protein Avbf_07606 [Armadillidium vulgare]